MNKKIIIAAITAIVVVGMGTYFLMTKNPKVPSTTTEKEMPVKSVTGRQNQSEVPCSDIPEELYIHDKSDPCTQEKYLNEAISLFAKEKAAGDEEELTYITNIYKKSGEIYLDADYVEWLSDSEGTCNAPGTPDCGPNGFIIDNYDSKIQTFKLSPDVKIRFMSGSGPKLETLSPQELMNKRDLYVFEETFNGKEYQYYRPFNLILKGGKVLFIHEQFTP
jgi:hypothetical protein